MDNEKEMETTLGAVREVFMSDRMIVFQHIAQPLPPDSLASVITGSESSLHLETLVHDFLNRTENKQCLALRTDDVESSWNKFLSSYDIVEAAGGLVLDHEGRLLMIHRYGKWDLPKGKLEEGEGVLEGAIREVIEECGIRIIGMIRPLNPSHHTYVHKGRKCLKRTHWFLFSGEGDPVPQQLEGIVAAEWLSPPLVKKALDDTYSSIRRVVFNAFPDGDFG